MVHISSLTSEAMGKSNKWEIKKNRLDMDYQHKLQDYQIISGALYALPLTILGIFLSQGFSTKNFLIGSMISLVIFFILSEKKEEIENGLKSIKGKVARLTI